MTDATRIELLQELDRRVFLLAHLVNATKERLSELEKSLLGNTPIVTAASSQAMSRIQRIVRGLEERIDEINALVASGQHSDIVRANVLIGADLVCKNDAIHKLFSEESLPPLAADKWASYIEDLFRAAGYPKRRGAGGLF